MTATPFFISARQRKLGKGKRLPPAPPPFPHAPVLASAQFVLGFAVDFSFDRGLNVAGIVPAAFILDDNTGGNRLRGTACTNAILNSFRMEMETIGPAQGSGTTLNVSAANGLVAQADGSPWAGVTNLELPYP